MKSIFFKLFFVVVVLFGTITFTSCSDKDDDGIETIVTLKDLPLLSQTFLSEYFPGIEINKIEKQTYSNSPAILYEVDLKNGFEVVFDGDGEWMEISAPDGSTIPDGIIPESIQQYVTNNYPGYGIEEINRTGNGYNVELKGNLRLTFNLIGECTGTYQD